MGDGSIPPLYGSLKSEEDALAALRSVREASRQKAGSELREESAWSAEMARQRAASLVDRAESRTEGHGLLLASG